MKESLLNKIPDNTNFLQLTKFFLVFPELPFGRYFCQSVNMPGVSTSEVLVPTLINPTYRHGDTLQYEPLTVTALIDEDFRVFEETYNWLKGLTTPIDFRSYPKGDNAKTPLYNDAVLTVNTNANITNFRVKFRNCHPVAMGGVNFSQTLNADTVPTVDITFRYDVFEIDRLDN